MDRRVAVIDRYVKLSFQSMQGIPAFKSCTFDWEEIAQLVERSTEHLYS